MNEAALGIAECTGGEGELSDETTCRPCTVPLLVDEEALHACSLTSVCAKTTICVREAIIGKIKDFCKIIS